MNSYLGELFQSLVVSDAEKFCRPKDLISRIIGNCPGCDSDACFRQVQKDPHSRIQTAREIGNELREINNDISEIARPRPGAAPLRDPSRGAASAAASEDGFWVAVLPFKYNGGNPDIAALAAGLTEDIVTGLTRFSYLRVSALSSTLRYREQAVDVRSVARDLSARYVMTGGLRQAGARLRLAVQLVDASSGVHLWAETDERATCDRKPCSSFRMISYRGLSQQPLIPTASSLIA